MAEGKDVERGRRLLIPPFLTPQQERKEQRRLERRMKIKSSEDVEDGVVRLPPDIHDALDKPVEVEITAPGGSSHEKKKVFKVTVSDKVPSGEIQVSPNELRALGVAENTVVTIRKR